MCRLNGIAVLGLLLDITIRLPKWLSKSTLCCVLRNDWWNRLSWLLCLIKRNVRRKGITSMLRSSHINLVLLQTVTKLSAIVIITTIKKSTLLLLLLIQAGTAVLRWPTASNTTNGQLRLFMLTIILLCE